MVEKHLDAIRAKESEARERELEARSAAEEIIEKAHREGERLLADTKIEGTGLIRSLSNAARAEAEKMIEKLRVENAEAIGRIDDEASQGREGAVDLILGSFRKGKP
jgi:hypothetical protein